MLEFAIAGLIVLHVYTLRELARTNNLALRAAGAGKAGMASGKAHGLGLVSSGMITTPDLMKLIHKATADTALPGVGEV